MFHADQRGSTITANVQINDISNPDIDNPQEALIFLLELLLVEYLDSQYAIFCGPPKVVLTSLLLYDDVRRSHVEYLIPIRIQGLFDDMSCASLFSTDCSNSKGVRKSCIIMSVTPSAIVQVDGPAH